MARTIEPDCRQCRREGCKLFLKGERCTSKKCAMERRPVAPGQHGAGRKRVTEYGTQLRKKEKVKKAYGILEKQFRRYYEEAERMKGVTGENMKKVVTDLKGNVVEYKELGEKKLAYPIKKELNGYYFVMQFEAAKDVESEVSRKAGLDENILRHLIVRLDEE